MEISEIEYFASLKGLNLLGTGDALHPYWLRDLERNLVEDGDAQGLYRIKEGGAGTLFLVQTEVATVHEYMRKVRRIHHVILMESLEVAKQLQELLSNYGDLSSDGRPVLSITPSELVEIVMSLDDHNFVFPAHAWTPWWSLFGAFSGVDTVEECYEDMSHHIHAIETGLSSDPPMNWRLSSLDRYLLISSSDAHSPYPFRLGREAIVFNVERLSYRELIALMRRRDKDHILMTLEVPPSYGKYHWSGHRRCGYGPVSPAEARRIGYRCPVCGKRLTKGVEDRVEELADRPYGYVPEGAIDFRYVLPLQELIALSLGIEVTSERRLNSGEVVEEYQMLIRRFGDEYRVLLEAPINEISEVTNANLSRLISRLRSGKMEITPGYDGVYGRLNLWRATRTTENRSYTRLEDYSEQ
ncbi:MAG: endonuclease Q family protein [Aigarchaeota archaeon]|nr:endonuclease Q family protein [Aigarchaeota archaeon]MDW8092483.1 endonuclease Q family protein [Nitrososphaerota archaeon]